MTERRRKLLVIDDPLDVESGRRADARPSRPAPRDGSELRALYVRLPAVEFDNLSRAAFELGAHKRDLVRALIRAYVDPHTPDGLAEIRSLLEVRSTLNRSPASGGEVPDAE